MMSEITDMATEQLDGFTRDLDRLEGSVKVKEAKKRPKKTADKPAKKQKTKSNSFFMNEAIEVEGKRLSV